MPSDRENSLRTIRFEQPESIPCVISLTQAIWNIHREGLEDVVLDHPDIFPPHKRGGMDFDFFRSDIKAGEEWIDEWGSVWHNLRDGMKGQPKVHPLADWKSLETFSPPAIDPVEEEQRIIEKAEELRREGKMIWGGSDRFFERLYFLRGFNNLMKDLIKDPPELHTLVDMVLARNISWIEMWIDAGADGIRWGDDLGMQDRPMMSNRLFRKQLYPGYSRMCSIAREAGCETYLHSDGRILELMDDLLEIGFTVINPQITINDIDVLENRYKGRVCIDADIDRQQILPRGSPDQVRKHVEEIVTRLGSREGGLMMIAGIYADAPLKNIKALAEAMEEYRFFYS